MWYVDENSNENALHLTLGKIPYDVRYAPSSGQLPSEQVPIVFQAPRHRVEQQVVVKPNELKSLTLDSQIKTLTQVRAAALVCNER